MKFDGCRFSKEKVGKAKRVAKELQKKERERESYPFLREKDTKRERE